MLKLSNKIRENKSGTALLTAMLIMGVLITVSVALSGLVMREFRVTKDLLNAGKAFYAAESGIEEALYYLNNKLPGWSEGTTREFGDGPRFKYSIKNTCNSYPCIDPKEYDVDEVSDMSAFYAPLDLNRSVLIPLFVVKKGEDGYADYVKSVKNFTVEFYGDFDPASDLKLQNVSAWDILRWKVFGMRKVNDSYVTEAISDFTAFTKSVGVGDFTNAENPSWFGTVNCGNVQDPNRLTGGITCNPYTVFYSPGASATCNGSTEARDYYGNDENGDVTNRGCFSIAEFVKDHQAGGGGTTGGSAGVNGATGLNYLSLTNIMNPAMFDTATYPTIESREKASRIYFRVETYEDETAREVAEIISDGYAGDSKQSIRVTKKKDSYMPVFNFSIYSTYGSEKDYYYDGAVEE